MTQNRSRDRLGMTLLLAAAVHAIVILSVGFRIKPPEPNPAVSLDVILVQTESTEAPEEAANLAQANQLASGRLDTQSRPTAPVTGPSPVASAGIAPIQTVESTSTPASPRDTVLTARAPSADKAEDEISEQSEQLRDLAQPAMENQRLMEIAQLTAELARHNRRYGQRPRTSYLDTLSAKTAVEAAYVREWVEKVERVGNLNYPDEARRRKLKGTLIVNVLIDHDGQVLKAEIATPSGQQVLDDATLRIIRLAAPFKPFPEEMRETYDQLMITRTWVYEAGDTLSTR